MLSLAINYAAYQNYQVLHFLLSYFDGGLLL